MAIPGGFRSSTGVFGDILDGGNYWTTGVFSANAFSRGYYFWFSQAGRFQDTKSKGYSVRCIQD